MIVVTILYVNYLSLISVIYDSNLIMNIYWRCKIYYLKNLNIFFKNY